MDVSILTATPVVLGVLTCMEEEQAVKRSTGDNNHGRDWGKQQLLLPLLFSVAVAAVLLLLAGVFLFIVVAAGLQNVAVEKQSRRGPVCCCFHAVCLCVDRALRLVFCSRLPGPGRLHSSVTTGVYFAPSSSSGRGSKLSISRSDCVCVYACCLRTKLRLPSLSPPSILPSRVSNFPRNVLVTRTSRQDGGRDGPPPHERYGSGQEGERKQRKLNKIKIVLPQSCRV